MGAHFFPNATMTAVGPLKPDAAGFQLPALLTFTGTVRRVSRACALLEVKAGFELTRLPAPTDADVFLDTEGDPFVGEHGLKYPFYDSKLHSRDGL
jgi:hypothetical protein